MYYSTIIAKYYTRIHPWLPQSSSKVPLNTEWYDIYLSIILFPNLPPNNLQLIYNLEMAKIKSVDILNQKLATIFPT